MKKLLFTYDDQQRISSVTQGERSYFYKYNANGEIDSITNPLLKSEKLKYNADGLPVTRITPDTYYIFTTYDENGNVATIKPPGREAYTFEYNAVNLPIKLIAPLIGSQHYVTQYDYNLDRQLELTTFPDGRTIDYVYEEKSERLSKIMTPRGEISYIYSAITNQPEIVATSQGEKITYIYDGNLLKEEKWTGVIQGTVNNEYSNDFQRISSGVNETPIVYFSYDQDGFLTKGGELSLTLDTNTGSVVGTTIGNLNTALTYNDFGELANDKVELNGNVLYETSYTRDKLGRVSQKIETVGGQTSTYQYHYDSGNRLKRVYVNNSKTEDIFYDSNGNRTSYKVGSTYYNASFDEQDRLTRYAGSLYHYSPNGDLKSKTTKENLTTHY
ncbi:RHS repeat protein, partial [Deltaproteobacteria bacterium TL4]